MPLFATRAGIALAIACGAISATACAVAVLVGVQP